MKLFEAYLDGWRVVSRILAFAACMLLFSLPFALALWLGLHTENQAAVNALLGVGFALFLPLAAYLASWYSGEFRKPSLRQDDPTLAKTQDEEY